MKDDPIRDELEALERDGVILPRAVVAWAAAHPNSAIYAALEWDEETAANEYRIWQVRRLIAVHIVNAEGDRQFLSLTIDRVEQGGYRRLDDVIAREELRDVMLEDALQELQRVEHKYNRLQELVGVFAEIAKVRKRQAMAKSKAKPTQRASVSRRKPAREERPGA